jgi:Alginate lyase
MKRFASCCLATLLIAFAWPPCANAEPFRHPGILNNQAELDFIRDRVQAGAEPWKSAFNKLTNSRYASLAYTPRPRAVVEAGPYSRPDLGAGDEKSDAIAAYTHALLWQLTGKKAHAEKAIEIMNAWSAVIQEHQGFNAPLQSSWVGSVFPRAAEIIRYTDPDWKPAEIERFSQMLRKAYLPYIEEGRPGYNGNWELSMIEAMTAIGVFLDDEALFQKGLSMWRKRVPAYFYLTQDGELPVPPPLGNKDAKADLIKYWYGQTTFVDGLAQETCRDFGHTFYGLAAMVNTAETARQQGIDLYGEEAQRITKAMEFHAALVLGKPVPPWLGGGQLKISAGSTWEIAYNHYHNRMGMELPQTEKLILTRARPTGADHHIDWETLTHAELGSQGLPTIKAKEATSPTPVN